MITKVHGATDVLGQIKELGWHLEHVGYVFVETGAVDRNKVFSGGNVTRTDGYVQEPTFSVLSSCANGFANEARRDGKT